MTTKDNQEADVIKFSKLSNPDSWEPEHNHMFEAFIQEKSIGDYKKDELRFNEFQRGWNAAIAHKLTSQVAISEARATLTTPHVNEEVQDFIARYLAENPSNTKQVNEEAASGEAVVFTQEQIDYINAKMSAAVRSWKLDLVTKTEFININKAHFQTFVGTTPSPSNVLVEALRSIAEDKPLCSDDPQLWKTKWQETAKQALATYSASTDSRKDEK